MAKTSYFDLMSHPFKCESPQCGETFETSLRSLFHENEVVCPKCGMYIDMQSPRERGRLALDFNTATQLNKKLNKRQSNSCCA